MNLDRKGKLKVSEADVQRACVELLRSEGWIVRPAPKGGHKAARGAHSVMAGEPDIIAVRWTGYRWRVLMVEVKAEGGRLSKVQAAWWKKWHYPCYVIRSVGELKDAVLLV